MVSFNPLQAETKIISVHDYLSQCHLNVTLHGFDYPEDDCFCVQLREKNNE